MTVIMDAATLNTFMMQEFPQVAAEFRVARWRKGGGSVGKHPQRCQLTQLQAQRLHRRQRDLAAGPGIGARGAQFDRHLTA